MIVCHEPEFNQMKLEFMFMKHYAPNRCEPSIEALNFGGGGVKFLRKLKKNIYIYFFFFFFLGGGGLGGGGGGFRMNVNEELKFLGKFTKKNSGGGVGRGGVRWGVGLVGVRVDENAMLGVGGDVGYGRCEPRIEGIVQCTKRYCTILKY